MTSVKVFHIYVEILCKIRKRTCVYLQYLFFKLGFSVLVHCVNKCLYRIDILGVGFAHVLLVYYNALILGCGFFVLCGVESFLDVLLYVADDCCGIAFKLYKLDVGKNGIKFVASGIACGNFLCRGL